LCVSIIFYARPVTQWNGLSKAWVHNCNPFPNQLPGRLPQELADAARVGAKPIPAGGAGFDAALNEGTIKWVVTESGELLVTPHTVNGLEISHAVLSNGRPVLAAGQADIASAGGIYTGIGISEHSGHFMPLLKA
jgi:hypothetical protein